MSDISPIDAAHGQAADQAEIIQTHVVSPDEAVFAHAAHSPSTAYPIMEDWASLDVAPRPRWSLPENQPKQKIFVVKLRADGLEDFEVPAQTITMRLRDVKASYVSCNIPDPTAYTQEILARTDGRMHIYAGELTADDQRHLEELIYANIQSLYFNQGATNVLTLTGTRFITHQNPKEIELDGISRIVLDENERYRVRCGLNLFVKPADLVTALGRSFTVDFVNCVITASDAYMDVEGR